MSYKDKKVSVVIPAAGMGSRMKSNVNKQYMMLKDKAILAHTVGKFEDNDFVDDIVIVAKEDEISFCKSDIVDRYGFKKVKNIVSGGSERRDSVYNGLKELDDDTDIILIHDGARPFIDNSTIVNSIKAVLEYQAIVIGVPVKDTIKVVDEDNIVENTPNRDSLWIIQTPQGFLYDLIVDCYDKGIEENLNVTDDSMLVEHFGYDVKMIMGNYRNIKITTREDLLMGRSFLEGDE